ncbi:peptide chain release factor N(5)-glutamine methyltransferase [candidate division CSSED10-310 bacterium]|uniref:Release factor glutamine methyltransferase n=1 Tax=candidate division CSSED10-310 bacterium TaxID=2855610 RepID=A0ABV6Z4R3_UNCC1
MKWTISRLLHWTTDYFKQKEIDSPRLDAEILLAHVLGVSRIHLYTNFDKPLEQTELASFREFVSRRGKREPIAYIIQSKEFYSLEFYINSSVLIPRPETELLVELAIKHLPEQSIAGETLSILDIGTGSGAVLLSIGHHLEKCNLVGTDIDPAGLRVARKNAIRLGLSNKTLLLCCDLFPHVTSSAPEKYDVIVSNPPYIPTLQIDQLQPEIADFEPRISLDGGPKGLDFYLKIIRAACEKMPENGIILLEVNDELAPKVKKLFEESEKFHQIENFKDYAGITRVMKATKKGSEVF